MNNRRVETEFNAALARESSEERAAYLDNACADDPELRSQVDSLLKAHSAAGNFLKPPPTLDSIGSEAAGGTIGRYKLLQEIGEGGFGVVYMAEQQEPVRRKVALKIIKLGMDTKQVVARFESERQALALMDHLNIARALDAGATDSGRPYFVMELVRGIPINEYCDQNNLPARDRLLLFIAVCQAIQHAHQKGIIHRDLKPSNVLVTLHDGKPVPKVIDFGIAKATNQRLTDKTLFTEFRQFIGTPQYMSPEQAEMSGLDIDTRSDIYSLGVLLYELLTGTTPFEAETLQNADFGELQRLIREQEPPTPSARLSTIKEIVDVAKQRRSEPEALSRLVRGDLDWIVMKALEKDWTRRYETAKELAADVERHLDNRPVIAGPPTVAYRLRKFLRRNRVAVLTGSLVTLALLIGLSLATVGFYRARREAAHSQEIADFLQEMLASVDPQEAAEGDLDVASVVTKTRELFGDDHSTVAATLSSLALQLQYSGQLDAAEPLYREALKIWRDLHGDEHMSVGITLTRLGRLLQEKGDDAGAERALREGIELTKDLPGRGRFTSCETRVELAQILTRRGKLPEAETLLRDAIRLRREQGRDNGFFIGGALEQLTLVLTSQGKYDEAEVALVETMEAVVPIYRADSLRAGTLNAGTGLWFRQNGKPEKAESYFREAIRVFRLHENPPRELYLASLDGLFQLARQQDDSTEAISVFHECMENMPYVFGPDHMLLAPHYFGFAKSLQARGRDADSIPLLIEGIRISREAQGDSWADADKRLEQLAEVIWRVALAPGLTNERYESALTGATTLSENAANENAANENAANENGLLGVIQYRLGNYQESLDQLTAAIRARESEADEPDKNKAFRERVFLAMTQFRLSQFEAAKVTLANARNGMKAEAITQDPTNRAVDAEAESLILKDQKTE